MLAPLLALDVDSVIGFAFVVFWVIAWLFKLATGQTRKGPPVPNRPRPTARPRDEKLQDEIDIFIQEVGPKKAARRPPASTAARSPIPAKPTAASGKRPKPQPERAIPPVRPAPHRARPGEEIATRHMPDSEQSMGSGVKKHLAQHMAERVSQEASAYLKPKVEQSVTEHLGRSVISEAASPMPSGLASGTPRPATGSGGGFTELFRDPTTLRQAMVVSLILSPPPGRKPRPAS